MWATKNDECTPDRLDDCKFSVNSGDVATAYSLCEKLLYLECNNKFQLATLLAIC